MSMTSRLGYRRQKKNNCKSIYAFNFEQEVFFDTANLYTSESVHMLLVLNRMLFYAMKIRAQP